MNKNHQNQSDSDILKMLEEMKDQLSEDQIVIADKWAEELSAHDTDVYDQPSTLYAIIPLVMEEPGLLARLEALDSKSRVHVIGSMYKGILWAAVVHDHLDVLEIANYPDVVLVRNRNSSEMDEFQKRIKDASDEHFVYSEFNANLNAILKKMTFHSDDNGVWYFITDLEVTEFLILRAVFGEEILTQVLERGVDEHPEGFQPTAASLIPILKDWHNLKDYPIEWLLNITSKNHITSLK